MIMVYPQINALFHIENEYVNELVVENQTFFREIVKDISEQISGMDGKAVLSADNSPVEWKPNAEMLLQFTPFEINKKALLNKICAALERESLSDNNYLKTSELLTDIEKYINVLCLDLPCSLNCTKLNIGGIIRSLGLQIEYDSESDIERIVDYMELVREFDRNKLFIAVNMRSYFSDEETELFIETVLKHDLKLLLLESCSRSRLKLIRRVTIDNDLCEF